MEFNAKKVQSDRTTEKEKKTEEILHHGREEDEGRFGAILVNYRQIEEIPSVLNAGRLQMRHEKSRAPTYRPAAEVSGAQFEISSGTQFENADGPNCV
ncbi:hypothetical protein E2C01_035359 [Portunus trituberculatus]|uniref:Uncharacterized protein n=1 Tax=Portunus trituberculatus TaxID=210409 RepID=A0A5B7F8Z5_PORTR|nr:hypothetical protein [Portunus trituberculatus]